jgi:hypothetical protein
MTWRDLRSLRVPLAIAGAALLGLAPTTMSPLAFQPHTVATAVALRDNEALIMAGTGACCTSTAQLITPGPPYTTEVDQLFIAPNYPGYIPLGLATPEQFAPFVGTESLNTSISGGVTDLTNAVMQQLAEGNDVVVFGFSQSATVSTVYEDDLATLTANARPSPDQLSVVLIGDPDNPDGGLFERIPGVTVPLLGYTTFFGPTPDDLYPTIVYTGQYDGFADFPQYPLDIPADLNALLGVAYVHADYRDLTPAQIAAGVVEPVTTADTDTTYVMIPTENLPLLDPLREIGVPAALLDLIQPDLRVLIDWGYGDGSANVPTPFGLFNTDISLSTVATDLVTGTEQGLQAALVDLGVLPASDLPDAYPYLAEVGGLYSSAPVAASDALLSTDSGTLDGLIGSTLAELGFAPGSLTAILDLFPLSL